MRRVYQRIVDAGRGDCMTACLASILDLPYTAVPPFVAQAYDMGQPHKWHALMCRWLKARKLGLVCLKFDDLYDWRTLVGIRAMLSVPSQRFAGQTHAVVGTWVDQPGGGIQVKICHDPNRLNKPYPPDVRPSYVRYIVPKVYHV